MTGQTVKLSNGFDATLYVVYSLVWLRRTVVASLFWRVWGRRRTAESLAEIFKKQGMPKPGANDMDAEYYLADIKSDPDQPVDKRMLAAECVALMQAAQAQGLLINMRSEQTWRDAMQAYRTGA